MGNPTRIHASMTPAPELSVVIPVAERFDDLPALYQEYRDAIAHAGLSHEFVFVVDGGVKAAAEQLRGIAESNERVTVLRLARHFGESVVLSAGFERAAAATILTLPPYYQIEPGEITKMLGHRGEFDMLAARRWPRAGSLLERLRRDLFHWMLRVLSGESFRDLGCKVWLLKREVVATIELYGDLHRFFPVIVSHQGFTVSEVDVRQSPLDRFRGRYRLREYLHRVLDIVTVFFLVRFTRKPLRFFGMIGSTLAALGGGVVLVTVVQRIFFNVALADRPAVLLGSLLLVLGVQTFALGLIGELIIFTHADQIEPYQIAEIIE